MGIVNVLKLWPPCVDRRWITVLPLFRLSAACVNANRQQRLKLSAVNQVHIVGEDLCAARPNRSFPVF